MVGRRREVEEERMRGSVGGDVGRGLGRSWEEEQDARGSGVQEVAGRQGLPSWSDVEGGAGWGLRLLGKIKLNFLLPPNPIKSTLTKPHQTPPSSHLRTWAPLEMLARPDTKFLRLVLNLVPRLEQVVVVRRRLSG